MIIGLIMIIWFMAMVQAFSKSKRKYIGLQEEALYETGKEENSLEGLLTQGSILTLALFVAVICIESVMGQFNQRLLLWMVVLYTLFYYGGEYAAHYKWGIFKEGMRSSRQFQMIPWENIVNYRWCEQKNRLILRVNYKGRGIVTRKCDYVVEQAEKGKIERLLENKVIVTRG